MWARCAGVGSGEDMMGRCRRKGGRGREGKVSGDEVDRSMMETSS